MSWFTRGRTRAVAWWRRASLMRHQLGLRGLCPLHLAGATRPAHCSTAGVHWTLSAWRWLCVAACSVRGRGGLPAASVCHGRQNRAEHAQPQSSFTWERSRVGLVFRSKKMTACLCFLLSLFPASSFTSSSRSSLSVSLHSQMRTCCCCAHVREPGQDFLDTRRATGGAEEDI